MNIQIELFVFVTYSIYHNKKIKLFLAKNLIAIKARYLGDIVCPFQRKVFENSYSFISGPGMKETSIYFLHPDGSPMIPPKHTQSTL